MKKRLKIFSFLLLFSICLCGCFLLYLSILPAPVLIKNSTIRLYDDEMSVFYNANNQDNIQWVDYEDLPQFYVDALISTEDRNFYDHFGFDVLRLIKAAYENIKANDIVQGGSTITQQVAKNLYLTQEQTLSRKIQELVYAIRLEMNYTKEEILEAYINTVYFGHGITGVNTAANFFFDKDISECSDAQVSILAGIPNGPSYYSPFNSIENSKQRQEVILNMMVDNNKLSPSEAADIFDDDIYLADYQKQVDKNIYGYYKDAVFVECVELGFCTDEQMSNGLDIYTYYDPVYQDTLQNTINDFMNESSQEVAMILLEPFTFEVSAISGGTNYTTTQYNRALYSKRQVGSTIKPLLYYIALNQGMSPDTLFLSSETNFQLTQTVSYTPQNYRELYTNEEISMIHAISTSDNIYAVKTHLFLGMNMLYDALLSFGIEQSEPMASMALGATDFPLIDLAKIYNTFASEGLVEEPSFIKSIKDSQGNIIYSRTLQPKQLLDRDDTLVLTSLLRAPFDIKNTHVSGPSLLGYEPYTTVSAKSGSSDWDSLIVGYNPLMTLVVWTGYDENQVIEDTEERRLSRYMFQDVFNEIFPKDSLGPWYEPSDNLEVRLVDPVTGEANPYGSKYWFKKEE